MELDVFGVAEAAQFLLLRAGFTDEDRFPTMEAGIKEEAVKIVEKFGRLPLAIEQASAYIRQDAKNIHGYLQTYHERSRELLDRKPQGNSPYSRSVAEAVLMSVNQLEKQNPDAKRLLEFFALLTPDGILIEFLKAGRTNLSEELKSIFKDDWSLNGSLGSLEKCSLIRLRSPTSLNIIYVHRIVQSVIRNSLSEELLKGLQTTLLAVSDAAFPEATDQNLALGRQFYAQVRPFLQSMKDGDNNRFASLFTRVGHFLFRDCQYAEADKLLQNVVEASDNHQVVLRATMLLSGIDRAKGEFDSAIVRLTELLNNRTDRSEESFELRLQIAGLYKEQNRLDEAKQVYASVLSEVASCSDTALVRLGLEAVNGVATVLYIERDYEAAEKLQECVSHDAAELLGEDDAFTLVSNGNLAKVYNQLGMYANALPLQERSLKYRISTFGLHHPIVLIEMSVVGSLYVKTGNVHDGEKILRNVLKNSTIRFGQHHHQVFNCKSFLAQACSMRAQLEESEELKLALLREASTLWEECFEFTNRHLGRSHPDTLLMLRSLICCCEQLGETEKGEALAGEYFGRSYEILTGPALANWIQGQRG